MKKKTVAAILVMCMVLSASACGKEAAKDTKNEKTTETTDKKSEEKAEKDDKTSKEASLKLVTVDDISDYVTIGEYKGLTLNRISQEVTDDDVQAEIDYDLEDKGEEIKDGTVESGDTVTINFTGTIDGKEFDGGSAEDYQLTVGEGSMIDGFEDGIIGMKDGETKELDLTFPEDYYDDSVAGKAVVFKVTLQKFTRKAELTDEWVAANTDYKTVDEYKNSVREQLQKDADTSADIDLYDSAWTEVLSASEIKKYPEADVNTAIEEYKAQTEQYVQEAGIEMSDFLEAQGISEDEYDDECKTYAESKVEQNLIVQGIMTEEGLTIEDNELDELKDLLCQEYGASSIDELVEYYGQHDVDESLALLRVQKFIVDQATVEEKTGSDDDLIANEDTDTDEDSDADMEIVDESLEEDTGDEATEDESEDAESEDNTDDAVEG
ncbi:trigger factor [Blautia sp. HCP28S3_G10]|uniref:trigger factor n=1 Tax=Blautia sp. HCP28S3_G10 TaxID=3438908 RepID=UPI003F8B32A8